jgi:HK97 family phage portal protein
MWDKIKSLFIETIPDTQDRALPDFKSGYTLGVGNVSTSLLSQMTTVANEQQVLSIATAYRCMAVRSEALAMLSGDIIQLKNGRKEYRNETTEYDLVFRRPNPFMTPFEWRRLLSYNKLVTGYGYGVVRSRDASGMALYLDICKNLTYREIDGDLYYYDAFRDEVYHHTDVICLKEIGPDGDIKSPLQIHRETFGAIKSAKNLENELYTSKLFAAGAITYPENIQFKKEQRDEMSENLRQNYGGVDKAGRVLVLDRGAKIQQFENIMSLADAEYIASANLQNEEVCRIYGVPPFKVFHFNKMTYDNMEQMSTEFVQSAVMPDVMQLEQEINYKLFSPLKAKQRYEIKFDLRSLMRADSTAQANWITKMVGVGALTVNEVREMDDRNPVQGGDDAFIQANNYFPLSKMNALADATIKGKAKTEKKSDPKQKALFDEEGNPVTDDEESTNVTQKASK